MTSRRTATAALLTALLLVVPARPHSVGAEESITREQADTLIKELRELRRVLESLRAPRQAERQPDVKVRVDVGDMPLLGRPDAPITLIEFTDLECPFCRAFHVGTFEQIKREYIDTGKVRFASRDFPLDIHPNARPAALAVRCAADQGKFWEMRHGVTLNAAALNRQVYDRLAGELGLDVGRFSACIAADQYRAAIERDMADGNAAGVTGTPTFVLGPTVPGTSVEGRRIVGALPFTTFDSQIKALLGDR